MVGLVGLAKLMGRERRVGGKVGWVAKIGRSNTVFVAKIANIGWIGKIGLR